MVEKDEQPLSLFLEAIPVLGCHIALVGLIRQLSVKTSNEDLVPFQEPSLESKPINRLHHRFEESSELECERLKLLIKGRLQQIVVQVSHKVDQALLLKARNRII